MVILHRRYSTILIFSVVKQHWIVFDVAWNRFIRLVLAEMRVCLCVYVCDRDCMCVHSCARFKLKLYQPKFFEYQSCAWTCRAYWNPWRRLNGWCVFFSYFALLVADSKKKKPSTLNNLFYFSFFVTFCSPGLHMFINISYVLCVLLQEFGKIYLVDRQYKCAWTKRRHDCDKLINLMLNNHLIKCLAFGFRRFIYILCGFDCSYFSFSPFTDRKSKTSVMQKYKMKCTK